MESFQRNLLLLLSIDGLLIRFQLNQWDSLFKLTDRMFAFAWINHELLLKQLNNRSKKWQSIKSYLQFAPSSPSSPSHSFLLILFLFYSILCHKEFHTIKKVKTVYKSHTKTFTNVYWRAFHLRNGIFLVKKLFF